MTDNNLKFFGPSFIPRNETIKNIVFLLHGYGANGDDLIDLANIISKRIPNTAFYAPNAPFELENGGFYMPSSYQWFTLEGYDPEKIKQSPEYFNQLCNKRLVDAQKVLPDLWQYIDNIVKTHNVSYKNVVVAGFSQGGLMALLTSLLSDNIFGGVISFSGVPLGDRTNDLIKNDIPILLTHGDSDEVVPNYALDLTEKVLSSKKIIPQKYLSAGISHSIDNLTLERAINFLEKILLH